MTIFSKPLNELELTLCQSDLFMKQFAVFLQTDHLRCHHPLILKIVKNISYELLNGFLPNIFQNEISFEFLM